MVRIFYYNLNYICNSKCVFCFSSSTNKIKELQITKKIVDDDIKKFGIEKGDCIIMNGGEPTLDSYFYDIIGLLQTKNIYIKVYTNFRNIDLNKVDKNYLLNFYVPIHGNSAIHDNITRINGSFAETMKNLIIADKKGINYSLKFIINAEMIKNNFNILDFLKNNNLSTKNIIIARLNKTKKSIKNNYSLPNNSLLKQYVINQISNMNEFNITLLDFPLCWFLNDENIVTEKAKRFYFSDPYTKMCERKYVKDLLMCENCTSCKFYSECSLISSSYLTLKKKNNKYFIEEE